MTTVLQEVRALGQQIWLDNLSRSLVLSGGLQQLTDEGIYGITSNPAIFQKSFAGDPCYTEDIVRLKQQAMSAKERYELLATADVRNACDVLLPLHRETGADAGFVSLEVDPELARDAEGTVKEARRLHAAIGRDNLMIKVPATAAGFQAAAQLIAEGISVNLTLLFSVSGCAESFRAYNDGITRRTDAGLPVAGIRMVASFFVSRIDTAVDSSLPEHLQGRTAVAVAKTAYRQWQDFFSGPDFAPSAAAGAAPLKLLWASTGTKNPAYSDVLYVENLIGPDTVNTVPEATLAAFTDHGKAVPTLCAQAAEAERITAEVEAAGIDLNTLAAKLQEDGLQQFRTAFSALLGPLQG